MYLHVEPWATGEGLQQHEEANRECTALWRARGGGCKQFQVSDQIDCVYCKQSLCWWEMTELSGRSFTLISQMSSVILLHTSGQTLRLSWTWSAAWPKPPEPLTLCAASTGLRVEPVRWLWVRLSRGPLRPPATLSSSMIWRYGPITPAVFFSVNPLVVGGQVHGLICQKIYIINNTEDKK